MSMGTPPYPPLLDLMTMRGVKLLVLSNKVIQNLSKRNRGITPSKIVAGTYASIKEDVPTIDIPTTLIAHKDLSEDFVYEVTKALVNTFPERQQNFDFLKKVKPEELAMDVGIPFHPGALKYYKERGWIK